MNKVPSSELKSRLRRFKKHMDFHHSQWEMVVIFSKINQYYFTGTMQDGMLIIPQNGEATFWVRRSYERAVDESLFDNINPMKSFRDAKYDELPETVYLETEVVPLALYHRFSRQFPFKNVKSVDRDISTVRSIKSEYELSLMRESGKIHAHVLEDLVPEILKEGISEADLASELFSVMMKEGHHGVARFGMFDTEMVLGHVCFGESSIYPTYFDGASGNYGLSPAVPLIGSRENKLKKGDLVYIDIGSGVDGYHTDKSTTYMFAEKLPDHAVEAHYKCVDVQNQIAEMLKPGAIPSEIYDSIMGSLDDEFLENFMGFGKRTVKFLGHGIGLLIDELPVLAHGFNEPLEKGMVFAVEPKKGIKGIGMVGIENTFIVTPKGGECITGDDPGLIPIL
ncbi:M24 family metallopeptidase [Methanobacterium alcaliphilum]|uniref:M24 family metallopeptidase n=1 Tax=Methanobacterium alcaliphilum TaxID=392018 RepID=UPI00200A8DDF|nr:Xaa-Pro peptidase family protein [Methanobacterium alcaliphilum]MCK9150699.1 Xaa-Pro peptidase family protein [Methanobacterium alcaliphilum]